jgi:hypothetical protein
MDVKKILLFSFIVLTVLVIIFRSNPSFEKFYPVPDRQDQKEDLITEEGVLGYQIRKKEVIFITSDHKIHNIYLFDPEKNTSLKLNSEGIPVNITVNNDQLGFAPSYADENGNIYFDFGNLIRISPDNKVKIIPDYKFGPDEVIIFGPGNSTRELVPGKIHDYELPAPDSVNIALLETGKKYLIGKNPTAYLTEVCYLQITLGYNPLCEGYRLLLFQGSKKTVLPNFDKGKQSSKNDSGFIYVPYDKNFFTDDGSFIFLSQANQLYRFR